MALAEETGELATREETVPLEAVAESTAAELREAEEVGPAALGAVGEATAATAATAARKVGKAEAAMVAERAVAKVAVVAEVEMGVVELVAAKVAEAGCMVAAEVT